MERYYKHIYEVSQPTLQTSEIYNIYFSYYKLVFSFKVN